jgi:hypothetical protein
MHWLCKLMEYLTPWCQRLLISEPSNTVRTKRIDSFDRSKSGICVFIYLISLFTYWGASLWAISICHVRLRFPFITTLFGKIEMNLKIFVAPFKLAENYWHICIAFSVWSNWGIAFDVKSSEKALMSFKNSKDDRIINGGGRLLEQELINTYARTIVKASDWSINFLFIAKFV